MHHRILVIVIEVMRSNPLADTKYNRLFNTHTDRQTHKIYDTNNYRGYGGGETSINYGHGKGDIDIKSQPELG